MIDGAFLDVHCSQIGKIGEVAATENSVDAPNASIVRLVDVHSNIASDGASDVITAIDVLDAAFSDVDQDVARGDVGISGAAIEVADAFSVTRTRATHSDRAGVAGCQVATAINLVNVQGACRGRTFALLVDG